MCTRAGRSASCAARRHPLRWCVARHGGHVLAVGSLRGLKQARALQRHANEPLQMAIARRGSNRAAPCFASPTTSPRSTAVKAHEGVARCIASRGGQDARRPRFCGRTAADERRLRAPDRAFDRNRAVALSHRPPRRVALSRAIVLLLRAIGRESRVAHSIASSGCSEPAVTRTDCAIHPTRDRVLTMPLSPQCKKTNGTFHSIVVIDQTGRIHSPRRPPSPTPERPTRRLPHLRPPPCHLATLPSQYCPQPP